MRSALSLSITAVLAAAAAAALAHPPIPAGQALPLEQAHATEVWNLRTGRPILQGPSPRAAAVTYDSLTRPGAFGNFNLAFVDPNCYTNPACAAAGRNGYLATASSRPGDSWQAPLSPNTNQPTYIWGDDFSNDANLWGDPNPNSTRQLTQHVICVAIDNTGIADPNRRTRPLNVLFYDANVGTANPAAFVDGYLVNVPPSATAPAGPVGWILTVDTSGGDPIDVPRDGTLVFLFQQRRPQAANINSGAYFIAGGDLDPNAGTPPLNFPGPHVHVGVNDMENFWFAVDPLDNITPPAPPEPPASIQDVTDILNRNALIAWQYGLTGRTDVAFVLGFPHQMTTDAGCACVGFYATGVCATNQDAIDVVLFNYGTNGHAPFTNGDLDGDGDVDQDDIDIVLFDYGCTG